MYIINEDGTVTRSTQSNRKLNTPSQPGGSDDNFGCCFFLIIAIVICAVFIALTNNYNSSGQDVVEDSIVDVNSNNFDIPIVSGSVKKVWVDHNVTDSYGNQGMRIHVQFDINGMLNRTGQAAVYFYYENGNPLMDTNGQYCSMDGNVATHVDFTPNYDNCTYNDLSIFMPYSEMHISNSSSCFFTITLWDGNTKVTESEKNGFQFTTN